MTGKIAPGPRGNVLLGSLLPMRRDVLGFLAGCARDHGPVVRFEVGPGLGGLEAYLINDPDLVKHVFQDNAKNYRKSVYYRYLQRVLGHGLLTSDGDRWLRSRRLVQPAFHRRHIDGFARVMVSHTQALLDRFEALTRSGAPCEVTAEMSRLAFGIVGEALFGGDLDAREADQVARGLADAQHWFEGTVDAIVPLPSWLPTPSLLKMKRAVRTIDRTVFGAIADRRRANARGDARSTDLLQLLLEARHEDSGAPLTDVELRDELATFAVAGHETSANVLSWAFVLLDRHPEHARRVRDEAREALGDREPTADDLPRLAFTRRVVDETLRLYPPAWVLDRNANDDDEVGGFHIPKDAIVMGAPWVMHRTAPWWQDPERFDPDRFLPERSEGRPRWAYFPFGGGPRQCIGNHFALMESVLAVAMIAARYEVRVEPAAKIEPHPQVTLRPRPGVPARIARAADQSPAVSRACAARLARRAPRR